MSHRAPDLPRQTQEVVSYADDVHAWMYLDQVDGVLRYEAFVIGYDDHGRPTTLELVFEEGVFELSEFPQLASLLPKHWLKKKAERQKKQEDTREWARSLLEGAAGRIRSAEQTPWDLTSQQWQRLHAFCEQQEARLKRECRFRWIRRLRALGYDVIPSL